MSIPIVMIGGPMDGNRTAHLFGDSIIVEAPNSGVREVYRIVSIAGRSRAFDVAVPEARWNDGDWIIERLLAGYQGEAQ